MPTEKRLLYIMSDLAYITKLNPSKKAHEFLISDFHQLNGQFLDENALIEKNIQKLVDKLEPGSYQLVLPDFLFTNTMVNVAVKTEDEVKDYLNDHLLPDLKIEKDDFYINTSVLSNYGGAYKVQLTALEKGVILPLVKALKKAKGVTISAIAPLSFSIKSLISLEPSVSILQIGQELYLAQHYIGVDQCFNTTIDNASDFAETVKTLKGVEPSLQTLYLLSDALVDNKVKEVLRETLPVQQLADLTAEGEKIPSYIKKIIEAGAKTFSIPDYLLPQFEIDEKYDKELDLKGEETEEEKKEDAVNNENITKPAVIGEVKADEPETESEEKVKEPTEEKKQSNKDEEAEMKEANSKKEVLPAPKKIDLSELNQSVKADDKEDEKVVKEADKKVKEETETAKEPVESKKEAKKLEAEEKAADKDEINLAQFTNLAVDPSILAKSDDKKNKQKESKMPDAKPVIKNSSEGSGVLKMILISLLSLIVTVAIGIGIGYVVLQYTNRDKAETSPTEDVVDKVAEPEPTSEPEPVEINKEDYQLLVVNATTKAGYAGTIANDLEGAGFIDVVAANASGEYEEGNYLLLSDLGAEQEASNQALLAEIEEITELEWQLSDEIDTEDATGEYQAVLVLAQ
jgi:hypothetical protein